MLTSRREATLVVGAMAVLFSTLVGCGQSLPANETTYPVHGTATLNGEPLKGGKINFTRTDGLALPGQAKINPEGEYHAFCYARQDGLVPGEYKVSLESYGGEPKTIPAKYRSADVSDKTITVSEGDNAIDVDFETGDESGEASDSAGDDTDADAE